MGALRLSSLIALALLASGCGSKSLKSIRRMAAGDLSCPEKQVQVTTISKSEVQYLANACGRRAVYTYTKQAGAMRISQVEDANAAPPPLSGEVNAPPPPNDAPPPPPPPPPPR